MYHEFPLILDDGMGVRGEGGDTGFEYKRWTHLASDGHSRAAFVSVQIQDMFQRG